MIICQTPLRVSFFGGGTDLPEYFEQHGGAVLGSAIDKFIYHSVTRFPSELFEHSVRLAYSKVEHVRCVDDIEHKPFREILKFVGIEKDIEISLAADLPAFSGLGSSSSFTVGALNALNAYKGQFLSRNELARMAIHIERDRLSEAVGCQDQIFAAFGGINLVEFISRDNFIVNRVVMSAQRIQELNDSLLLFFTGVKRRACDIERRKINNIDQIRGSLLNIHRLVEKAHVLLTGNASLTGFGELLDETWRQKRELDPAMSQPQVELMYERAKTAGAVGGKLLGAGGGGFMLFFVPADRQEKVRQALADYYEVPFRLNAPGSSIIHS